MPSYPRETVEFVPVKVMVNRIVVDQNVELATTDSLRERPTVWAPAALLGGQTGLMLNHPAVGMHHVWARVDDDPEAPVVYCGSYQVT